MSRPRPLARPSPRSDAFAFRALRALRALRDTIFTSIVFRPSLLPASFLGNPVRTRGPIRIKLCGRPTHIYTLEVAPHVVVKPRPATAREEKLENLITNYSMIFMGMFEEGFSAVAERLTEAMSEATGAIVDSLAGTGKGKKLKGAITPSVKAEIGNLFSGIREEMSSQWPKNAALFKAYVADPAFDRGIEIVERHDFGRPKLTKKLSDEVLASYVFLLQSGDKEVGGMFKELAEWQARLPKPPWAR